MKKSTEFRINPKNLTPTTGVIFYAVCWLAAEVYNFPNWVFWIVGITAILHMVGFMFEMSKTKYIDLFERINHED